MAEPSGSSASARADVDQLVEQVAVALGGVGAGPGLARQGVEPAAGLGVGAGAAAVVGPRDGGQGRLPARPGRRAARGPGRQQGLGLAQDPVGRARRGPAAAGARR